MVRSMLKGRVPGYIHGAFWPVIGGLAAWAFNIAVPVVPPVLAEAVLALCGTVSCVVVAAHYWPDNWIFWNRRTALPAPTIDVVAVQVPEGQKISDEEVERRKLADALVVAQTRILSQHIASEESALKAIDVLSKDPFPELLNHLIYDVETQTKWQVYQNQTWLYCKARSDGWQTLTNELNDGTFEWTTQTQQEKALLAANKRQREAYADFLAYLKRV